MTSRALWLWASLSALGVAAVLFFTEWSLPIAVVGGVSSAIVAASYGFRVRRLAQARVDAYAAAARGELPEGPHGPQHAEPLKLAREVQSTAANAREMSRKLSVLRAVIDGMVEGVWITADDCTVIEHNNALKEMLYAGREIVGQRPLELLHSAELQAAVETACRDNQSSRLELAVEGIRPRVLSVHVSPLGRELGGSAAVFFDVTELRRLEKVRKDFVANVSTRIAHARHGDSWLRRDAEGRRPGRPDQRAPKMVDIIHRQSERLSGAGGGPAGALAAGVEATAGRRPSRSTWPRRSPAGPRGGEAQGAGAEHHHRARWWRPVSSRWATNARHGAGGAQPARQRGEVHAAQRPHLGQRRPAVDDERSCCA
jgi:PAS domain-containing protein